jgi:RND family efflux transporter MFP subunit
MKNIIQYAFVIAGITILASCGEKENEKKPEAVVRVKHNTMQLTSRQISSNVHLPGVMLPFQIVQLFPKVNGFVKYVSVDRGSVVKQGQQLITLEAPEIAQAVAAAKLKYTQAQANYMTSRDRYARLLETSKTPGTISPFDLEAAASQKQADSATAQGEYANYKAQETMMNYLNITAPFDGVITERNVHPGALAGPGAQNEKPMLVLQQLTKLRLTVDVPEQYAEQIKDGDTVQYNVNALPGATFEGVVSRSSESLSSNYRAETIEIDVPNIKEVFKPGMYAEVVLPASGNANAFVVPKTAVVTTTERKYVIIAVNNIAKWIDVSEGNQANDSTEIFGNLHAGDEVVTNATYQLKEGEEVK